MLEAIGLGPKRGRRFDALFEHAGLVGDLELDPLATTRQRATAQLGATSARRHRRVVFAQRRIAQNARLERAHHGGTVILEVLDQLQVGSQTEPIEQRHRRDAQQLREPGVEGADLDRPAGGEDASVQRRQFVARASPRVPARRHAARAPRPARVLERGAE